MSTRSRSTPSSRPAPATRGVAVVTGGAKRLGRTLALALAADGWDVAVHYGTSVREAASAVEAIRALGRKGAAFAANLDDEAETAGLMDRVRRTLGRPTCLVNCASRFQADDAATVDYASIAAHMRTNLAAPLVLARALHDGLPARGHGVVINLLDQKLFNLNPDFLAYTLSKAALHAATTMLAQAFAPKLRVVGIAPGITLPSGDQSRADFAKAHRQTPLGRSSTPDDVAEAVCYAARARAVTGSVILVDGGQHLVPTTRDVMFLSRA